MSSHPPMPFTEVLENFLKKENHLELTKVDIKEWIMIEHWKRDGILPFPSTVKRYANRLYKIVHVSQPE